MSKDYCNICVVSLKKQSVCEICCHIPIDDRRWSLGEVRKYEPSKAPVKPGTTLPKEKKKTIHIYINEHSKKYREERFDRGLPIQSLLKPNRKKRKWKNLKNGSHYGLSDNMIRYHNEQEKKFPYRALRNHIVPQ